MPIPSERLAPLMDYAVAQASPPDEVAAWLIDQTSQRFAEVVSMQSSWDQALMLGMLAGLARPRLVVEVGTFTGLVALTMARSLPDGGRLLACDVNEDYTALAREAWERGGVADRIDLVLAPATETLAGIGEPVDFAFVDADKEGYPVYLDLLLPRMAPHGVIAVDNTFSRGNVLDGMEGESPTMVSFNDGLRDRDDCEQMMLPIRDGVTLVRRV